MSFHFSKFKFRLFRLLTFGFLFALFFHPNLARGSIEQKSNCQNNRKKFKCPQPPTVPRSDQLYSSITNKLKNKSISSIKEQLKKTENEKFLDLIRDSVPHVIPEVCKSKTESKSEQCLNQLSEILWLILKKVIHPGTFDQALLKETDFIEGKKTNWLFFSLLIGHGTFIELQETLVSEIKKDISFNQLDERIRSEIFPKIKKILLQKAEQLLTNTNREHLNKIMNIQFGGSDCNDLAPQGQNRSDRFLTTHFMSQAYFSEVRQRIYLCNGFQMDPLNDLSLAFILGHELAHTLDPCIITHLPSASVLSTDFNKRENADQQHPLKNLITCLRSPLSLKAESRKNTFKTKIYDFIQSNKHDYCLDDQIGEAISDWFAAEVLSEWISTEKISSEALTTGIKDIFCKPSMTFAQNKTFTKHPDSTSRIERIVLANPKIFSFLGCTAYPRDLGYCNGTEPIPQKPQIQSDSTSVGGTQ